MMRGMVPSKKLKFCISWKQHHSSVNKSISLEKVCLESSHSSNIKIAAYDDPSSQQKISWQSDDNPDNAETEE